MHTQLNFGEITLIEKVTKILLFGKIDRTKVMNKFPFIFRLISSESISFIRSLVIDLIENFFRVSICDWLCLIEFQDILVDLLLDYYVRTKLQQTKKAIKMPSFIRSKSLAICQRMLNLIYSTTLQLLFI